MKKRKVTNIIVPVIFLSLLLFIGKGLSEFGTSKEQESLQTPIELDSLTKSKQEIIEYFENSQREKTRGGGILENTVPLELNIPFDFNSAELTKAAKLQLDELGEAMQTEVLYGISIKLAGHSDERGDADYNLRLSQKRVESAKNYLMRNYYIQGSQIYEIGYGESKPIIKNAKTEAEYAVNRRLEISPWEPNEKQNNSDDIIFENENNSDDQRGVTDNFVWGVFHVKDNGTEELINISGKSILQSNDKYRIYIKPPKQSYIYIYQEDSNGNGSWLFPRTSLNIKNPLSNNDNWIPPRNRNFSLDENTGTETIYIVASDKPDKDLGDFYESINPVPIEDANELEGKAKSVLCFQS